LGGWVEEHLTFGGWGRGLYTQFQEMCSTVKTRNKNNFQQS
jgi:hypothetical protein